MVVCFSIGKNSEGIIKKIKPVMDNVDFYSFSTISELIKETQLKHISFKRIVISNSIISNSEKELEDLNKFIKDYSANTEVVLLLNKNNLNHKEVEDKFNQIFNSPMYTVAVLGKASPRSVAEVITSDILEVQSKYYDVKKSVDKLEEPTNSGSIENTIPNTGEIGVNKSEEFSSGPIGMNVENMGENYISTNVETKINTENVGVFSDVSSGFGSENLEEDNFSDFEDELSLGDFGSSHSDTGYLDEEEESSDEELQAFLKRKQDEEIKKEERNEEKPVEGCNEKNQPIQRVKKEPIRVVEKSRRQNINLSIDILLSIRGIDTSQVIIDTCVQMVSENNAKVLLIDLDTKSNRLLSYIDVEKFYRGHYSEGIRNQKVYVEDGIGVISNGYSCGVTSTELSRLLSSNKVLGYDIIYIDCPLDCVGIISEDILDSYNIILNPGNSLTGFIETSRLLTNRSILSLNQERIIMSKCLLDLENYNKEDINLLNSMCLFANGNWTGRIGL